MHVSRIALLILLVFGCSSVGGQAPASPVQPSVPNRPLVVANRFEPHSLGPKLYGTNGPLTTTRLFNAALSLFDVQGQARPYLAESLPQLNTSTWRVMPDGRMETTYPLRSGLTWQDGSPLTADDFTFAFRVYKDPGLGIFFSTPQDIIDSVLAPDARTVVVQWKSLYASAGGLTFQDLDPLPAHLLQGPFTDYLEGRSPKDAFGDNAYWTTDYIGAGPYKLDRWDPGVQMEGTAFAGHALGAAKITRLVVRFFVEENATLAAVLAGGQLDYTSRNTLRFEQFVQLKREWEPAGKGTAIVAPSTAVFLSLQQRPEYVGDDGLLDLRIRQAVAHAIDRPAINDGLYDSLGSPTETPVPPTVPFYPDLDRILTKYPLDLSRSSQLMADAGFTRDGEGFYANQQGRRFHLDFAVFSSSELERMQAILSDSWRRAGFDVRTVSMASQLFTQLETRATLPGLSYGLFTGETSLLSSEIGSPANKWAGSNRSGWSNPEHDRLWQAANATLDPNERGRDVAQMMSLVSRDLPGYPLYFLLTINTWVASLQGPDDEHQNAGFGQVSKATTTYWNIYDWTLK
ncbi:MAG TPA: ABC transporter substrate-binding protein [Chloroflexota bacterium]